MTHVYGWRPSRPDLRNFKYTPAAPESLPALVDLRKDTAMPAIWNQGNLGSCHDAKTEVLTESGWSAFSSLTGTERLATVNTETGTLSFVQPSGYTRYKYSGPMICVKNQSLNFRVTPNHVMLIRKWDEGKRTLSNTYSLTRADELGWYCGLMSRVTYIGDKASDIITLLGVPHKLKKYRQNVDLPMVVWLRFLGIYLAEGTMLKRNQCKGRISYKIQIATSKQREKDYVRKVLQDLGVRALELEDRFTFSDKRVYEAMAALGLEGIKAGKKFVPSFVFQQHADSIKEFLAGHFAGDGSEQYGHRSHYTGSRKLADDLQALIFLSGQETRMHVRPARVSVMSDGREIIGKLNEHRVSVCEKKNLAFERKNSFIADYDGDVFCAEVAPYHTLVTRRNGKVLISGNCTAHGGGALQMLMHNKQRKVEKSFTPSRLAIYWGERDLEGSVEHDAGASVADCMKVLSKVGAGDEKLWPYDVDKFTKKPPKSYFVDAAKHKVTKYEQVNNANIVQMKTALAAGKPIVFGFTVYESFEGEAVAKTGIVPVPAVTERVLGGHCVLLVGYDDSKKQFIVRNSWGTDWGDKGYCYFDYKHLTNPDLATDFWVADVVV